MEIVFPGPWEIIHQWPSLTFTQCYSIIAWFGNLSVQLNDFIHRLTKTAIEIIFIGSRFGLVLSLGALNGLLGP